MSMSPTEGCGYIGVSFYYTAEVGDVVWEIGDMRNL